MRIENDKYYNVLCVIGPLLYNVLCVIVPLLCYCVFYCENISIRTISD